MVYGLNDGGAGSVSVSATSSYQFAVNISDISELVGKTVIGVVGINSNGPFAFLGARAASTAIIMDIYNYSSSARDCNPRCYVLYY